MNITPTPTLQSGNNSEVTIKIANTSAINGITKGDELHRINNRWYVDGDKTKASVKDDIVQGHPTLFRDKLSTKQQEEQVAEKNIEQSHSSDNPSSY